MKNEIAKLADFGFSSTETLIKGLPFETVRHMSPENLKGKRYSCSHDVYSLAIALWELWYGSCVVEEEYEVDTKSFYQHWKTAIIAGKRPKFTKQVAPVDDLKTIIGNCWKSNPEKRLEVSEVQEGLKSLYTSMYK